MILLLSKMLEFTDLKLLMPAVWMFTNGSTLPLMKLIK